MGRKKTGRRTETVSISLPIEVSDKLKKLPNTSEFVENAIRDRIKKESNPEILLKEIKLEKRRIAIKMAELNDQEEEIIRQVEEMTKEKTEMMNKLFNV